MLTAVEFAALTVALYRLGRMDYLRRIAGAIGFFCGAMLEAVNLSLPLRGLTEWGLAALFFTGVLFQREIRQLLR